MNKLRAPGSYRDPSGFVFFAGEKVYRTVAEDFWPVTQAAQHDVWPGLIESRYLVESHIVSEDSEEYSELKSCIPQWKHFIRHEKVDAISYPYEWCFSMLVDAALLHLDMQVSLLEKNYTLKDASSFNVQFVKGKPVFIDVLSIDDKPSSVWIAYSQFCRHFLYPIILGIKKGLCPRSIFLTDLEGWDVEQVYQVLGLLQVLNRDCFLDVFLQYQMGKKARMKEVQVKERVDLVSHKVDAQIMNLQRLKKTISRLASRYAYSGKWDEYDENNSYTEESRSEKASYIESVMREYQPETVMDVGCNTGVYSRIAEKNGASVISIDSDHDVIEKLYRVVRGDGLDILPLHVDLANPSPGMGLQNRERISFLGRFKPQCVFALALMHHLLVSARIPLEDVCEILYVLSGQYLVIEYVDPQDCMFKHITALRDEQYDYLSRDLFLAVFQKRFTLLKQQQLNSSTRTLYTFERL